MNALVKLQNQVIMILCGTIWLMPDKELLIFSKKQDIVVSAIRATFNLKNVEGYTHTQMF